MDYADKVRRFIEIHRTTMRCLTFDTDGLWFTRYPPEELELFKKSISIRYTIPGKSSAGNFFSTSSLVPEHYRANCKKDVFEMFDRQPMIFDLQNLENEDILIEIVKAFHELWEIKYGL